MKQVRKNTITVSKLHKWMFLWYDATNMSEIFHHVETFESALLNQHVKVINKSLNRLVSLFLPIKMRLFFTPFWQTWNYHQNKSSLKPLLLASIKLDISTSSLVNSYLLWKIIIIINLIMITSRKLFQKLLLMHCFGFCLFTAVTYANKFNSFTDFSLV